MTITLTGRLLCAAEQTYQIKTQGGEAPPSPPTPAPPPSTLVGYINDPQCWVDGPEGLNAALLGETATEIIVAFRGTEPFDSSDRAQMILDWLNDLDVVLVKDCNVPGLVHQGFLGSLNSLWPSLWPAIQAMLAANPGKPLHITGHSKGGAIAALAAMRCTIEDPDLVPYVTTFAAARCGNQEFADAYNKAVPHSIRIEYQDDIVPHLPPDVAFVSLLSKAPFLAGALQGVISGYVSVGDLIFYNWQNQPVSDSPILEIERIGKLAMLLFDPGGLDKIISDHSIDPGSGYAGVVCPGVWPAS